MTPTYNFASNKDLTKQEFEEALQRYADIMFTDKYLRTMMISLWKARAIYKMTNFGYSYRRLLRDIQSQEDRIQLMTRC